MSKVGQIFQNPDDQFLNVTVKEELDFSLKYNQNPSLNESKLQSILTKLNLENMDEQVVYSLSGGQKEASNSRHVNGLSGRFITR